MYMYVCMYVKVYICMYVCTLYMYVCEYVCISSADMLNTSDEKKDGREKKPFSEFSDYISRIEKLIYMFESMQPSFFGRFSWFQSILQRRAQRFLLSTFPSG